MEYEYTPSIIDRTVCRDFSRSSKLEWLNTNNTGAYAMGTVAGVHTRRYHGLLVASLHQPVRRYVTLAKVDEFASLEEGNFALATNQYPGNVDPRGFESLDVFRLDPFPQWSWQLGKATFLKEIFLVPERQAVAVLYHSSCPCTLRVKPFIAFRGYHDLVHANESINRDVEAHPSHLKMQPYPDHPELIVHHNGTDFQSNGDWYRNFEYLVELERGMDFREDLYTPGDLVFHLDKGKAGFLVACIGDDTRYGLGDLENIQKEIRAKKVKGNSPFEVKLTAASECFRAVRADGRPTIMAGFPWFADWGRDTMISLPGLLITRGLLEDARQVIESFLIHLNQGIIPNHYPDFGTPEYNTCDATLWMFQAVWSYMQCGGNLAWIRERFYPMVKEIIAWHERGTIYNIHIDPEDGLLSAGVDGIQLTWMDAKVGNWVVTPRRGKPVEVNALWYNALRMSAHWAVEFNEFSYAQKLSKMADKAQVSIENKFWNPDRNCLYDVLGDGGPDANLRPNQLFAISLPFDLFARERQQAIVRIVETELLTPAGLRTLERNDPDYRPRYVGDRVSRDGAYHQGTVWPWLLGPFITAYLKAFGKSDRSVQYCRNLVEGLEPQMLVDCVDNLNEIFDAEEPYYPRGCIAQAWSVAELLRILRTDLV